MRSAYTYEHVAIARITSVRCFCGTQRKAFLPQKSPPDKVRTFLPDNTKFSQSQRPVPVTIKQPACDV